ncbi:uncharacterized protein LOC105830456 [Monomorium pharaonis]|uniref:uncharacterized protein LOC105830456 n=1 Tax=Monomorium pharaonis TaxID=307658 RepID=UPI00063FA6E7|nr:uncharacterized protein LOC105830456 [Monomorium pharaonis]XP_036149591.1 uncharacterized protein LOC105830456 [Monomorium pharaonis]
MNYNGNMPDWHQYNPAQSGINDVTSTAQNVNSGHLSFMSSISPTCPTQLNGLNLSSDGLEKHPQNDPNFNPRHHFQPHLPPGNIPHGHNAADNNPLASMVQMQNCIGHYGPSNTRNPMVDNLNGGPMDPRNAALGGMNEELGYRNNQVPLNGPISHMNGPNHVMNMNASHASMGPRNANVNHSHVANRTGPPSFVPQCKAPCCNPDPNVSYQQYCYQNNAYRDNVRSSTGYQTDVRRFGSEYNFRKDNFDGKEVLPSMVPPNGPHNTKHRKDRLLSRNYPSSSGMLQNYNPMQNYNYPGEYQKYPYNMKEYSKMSGMNVLNQAMVKHPEQNAFAMPQQKYNNNKQVPYQTGGNAGMPLMPTNMPSTSVPNPNIMPPSAQNTYFNSQYPRNLPIDTSTHDCQEAADNAASMNRNMQSSAIMHTPSHPRYHQTYQQKLMMQRYSMENHLREMAKIPGYQSQPKYKECVHKYREILKLQQSATYQGQMQQQQAPCVAASTINTSVPPIPPINLQFDQNGVLINSNYMPEVFSRMQQTVNSQAPINSPMDKQSKQDNGIPNEMMAHNVQKPEQLVSQHHDGHTAALCASDGMQKQSQYPVQKSLAQNQLEMQKAGSFDNLAGTNVTDATAMQQKMSKEFADKPELDVRQFLANWDESEEEDGAGVTNLPNGAVLSNSTPVVVVGYENVDLSSAKTLENLEISKPGEITSTSVITFEAAENVAEIAKNPVTCKDIAKEAIVQPGGHIIQCISNGPDEVPTIHIVDNLEIGSILQVTNGQVTTETLERQNAVPFFQEGTAVEAAAITLEVEKKTNDKPDTATEYNTETLENLGSKKEYVVECPAPPKTVESTLQTSRVDNQGTTAVLPASSTKDSVRDMNLKKQNSFASEESHNPDDISLPDLPTSECTPISTTLNTPIHSDNEESSERVEDLTISTNPIEVMQNSPVISFTQTSPTKDESYDHHMNSEGGTVRNKPTDSLRGDYRARNRFKNNSDDNNMLGHDTILDTFEFSDKSETTTSSKERVNGISVSTNNGEKVFALGDMDDTETVEATSMRMTLTSGEYELKIVSTGAQNKSIYNKNLMNERRANESQTANPDAHKKLTETSALRVSYCDSTKIENVSQCNNSDTVDFDVSRDDVNRSGRRVSTEIICQTNRVNVSSSTKDTPRNSKVEDVTKNNSPTSHAKHLSSDKLRKSEVTFAKEDFASENSANGNRSARIDAKDPKSSQHTRLADRSKLISNDQTLSYKKEYLSDKETTERCDETIERHNKHSREAAMNKDKSCTVENPEESDGNSHNKPKVIENISVDGAERMRLLKEYRRIKYKSLSVGEAHDKSKDTQEAFDYAASKKHRRLSNPDERSASPCSNQLYPRDVARSKSEEQEGKHASSMLKTFVTKNVNNPDFAIQVTNVNRKRKDDEKGLQHLREETKSGGGSLDGIKIEINVSCTERNTTEKLLHENIKNAVAETIGHLTSSISNGARGSNSTSITEIQCDKTDRRNYERRSRSPSIVKEASAYNEAHDDHDDTEMRLKSLIAAKEDTNEGNVNTDSELASNALKILRSEQAVVRRRSIHQDTERKIAATSFCDEELKASSDNSPYGSRNVNVQKKDYQETAVSASSCRGVKNCQDGVTSRLSAVPSTSLGTADEPCTEDVGYDNPVHFDYNHFDVAPNETADAGDCKRIDRWKRSKRDDDRFGNFDLYESTSGYVNPTFFSADESKNLNTVPVYTTKDGKITYSPNPRYHELIMEARVKDSYGNSHEPYFPKSPSYDYYNCSKLRKVFKRKDIKKKEEETGKRREFDLVDAKCAAKSHEYLSSKNTAYKSVNCAKIRGTSHLEFFNDDADKLYTNKSVQEDNKESNKKNIVDLDVLEKQYKSVHLDSEPATSVNHCKSKGFAANNLEYDKEYNESSVFEFRESNLFLEPRPAYWEETMESIKSYSSHIGRRSSDNVKELNFSEIFTVQKRLDSFPFLPAEQDSSDNVNLKSNCDVTNDPTLLHTTCNYINDLRPVRDDDLQCGHEAVSHNEQKNECNNQNETDVNDKPVNILNASLNVQDNDEHAKHAKESQFNGDKEQDCVIELVEKTRSCPKITNEKIPDPEGDQYSTNYVKDKEVSMEHQVKDESHFHCTGSPKEDKFDAKIAHMKEVSEDSAKVASPFKLNVESKDSLDESKNTETVQELALTSNERDEINDSVRDDEIDDSTRNDKINDSARDDKINDSARDDKINDSARDDKINNSARDDEINDLRKHKSDSMEQALLDQETVHEQVLSTSINHKDKEKTAPATESNVLTEINNDQTNEPNAYNKDFAISENDEPIISHNPSNVVFVNEQTFDEEGNEEQQSEKPENYEQTTEVSLKDQGNDEVDTCSALISTPALTLDLRKKESVCDLFACERREQNISEFTVIKSIIKGDKPRDQQQQPEINENTKDCGNIIDSKLLCIDSSDCGIYTEDRCVLTQMSEHDFTEEDSMVPMMWETSQIQEDAVNRLCNIDEATIDFTGAVNSFQDNSLLGHLSLSRMSTTNKELPQINAEESTAIEIKNKAIDVPMPILESTTATVEEKEKEEKQEEESNATPSNDKNKEEQNQISSSNNYEKIAYLRATDCNANTKMVPKLVIKKSESSSKFITKMGSSSIAQDSVNSKSICHPKIPKMIIRNARSRPGTPSIESVHEETPAQANLISDRTLLMNEDLYESNSESSMYESSSFRNKIPKMKIKLDEKHSNKILRADDEAELCLKRKSIKKTIPKVKIKSTSRSDLADDCNSITSQDSRDSGKYEEKIPILKLKKQERNRSSSPEVTRKRQSSNYSEAVPVKKSKRLSGSLGRDEMKHSTKRSSSSDSTRTNVSECETKKNPLARISEKIPKVIIKRASASAEFKCELSKSCKNVIAKSAKWQPEVKLERYHILDNMVKDLKLTLLPDTLRAIDKMFASRRDSHRQEKQGDCKLSRSNSTSDLQPAKYKQRRMSDYDCRKVSDVPDIYFRDTKTPCTTPKKNLPRGYKSTNDEYPKDNKRHRSRSRDNNPRSEADVTSFDKKINQSSEKANSQKATSHYNKHKTDSFDIDREQADEDTISNKLSQRNTPTKHPSDSNFKLALKELKATSNLETCFVKLSGTNETTEKINLRIDKEQRKDDDKVTINKERRLSSSDMDDCTLQDDTYLLKDDSASMLDNFEVNNSAVIKVESSDESQSTIEILPASPDDSSELERHIEVEDGDREQLYSADAIPTQFELELEITDNSNPGIPDISMPKLDPICPRITSEESSHVQTAKLERYDKFDSSPHGKNSLGKNKRIAEFDINNDDDSVLENSSADSVKKVLSKVSCCKAAGFTTTRESFCCNDSLIKEVLAAKETLKKCLSKSKYDMQSSATDSMRLKTTTEKKQGSSFAIDRSAKVSSNDIPQGDVVPPINSTPMANKHKTENISNIEKSDKKHSKHSKSSFMKKKPKSHKKSEMDSKKATKNTPECNTISLKTFKQSDQSALNKNLSCTVHLNEKRKSLNGHSDDVLHRDPQRKEKNRLSSYKIPKISRSTDQQNNTSVAKEVKPKEDNMPVLQPEVNVNFDANSDRENSRSPPVITIQDNEDLGIVESKLMDDEIVMSSIKIESDTKDVHKKSEMSIVDFITQLAYHEKATIKHRRYCNLCERWFPTTSRHRRHLAGYQHRHIELTQRRSIHALFTLFTGKPCPRLVPANIVRSDCSVGELTPLQIAVQDVTKGFDHIQESPRKENNVDK